MLGGAKVLVAFVGGFAGITGFSSLSSLEWDPSNVWRTKNKNRFYLTTCRQGRRGDDGESSKWNNSVLEVYLTFKKGVSSVEQGAELQLVGDGHYQRFTGSVPFNSITYKNSEDLHQHNGGSETWFVFTVSGETGNNWLGETGGGPESERYGSVVMCNKKLFTFDSFLKTDGRRDTQKSADLLTTKFSLDCDANKQYKGVKGCSIKIESSNQKGLKWADGFDPIVI
ncbi:hypothetical protein WEN_03030 [Mycoplasma wenyonii str. Massachusetts]|uniref:Uncharacterized protein n=1 Tax=Mycoplasma wenyonii (strain Massachusetts) TaxID=1197325 RepID=I6YM61_MYCWM|nr:hypothetical protein [Mycoplasma wenyonii]AFN65389.1 hypothetical protein WEN_03030 [Mycoplasma wenyonii str. Massachusetts]